MSGCHKFTLVISLRSLVTGGRQEVILIQTMQAEKLEWRQSPPRAQPPQTNSPREVYSHRQVVETRVTTNPKQRCQQRLMQPQLMTLPVKHTVYLRLLVRRFTFRRWDDVVVVRGSGGTRPLGVFRPALLKVLPPPGTPEPGVEFGWWGKRFLSRFSKSGSL